jgi:hypothetical protein
MEFRQGISSPFIKGMRALFLFVSWGLFCLSDLTAQEFQLAAPQVEYKNNARLFQDSTVVTCRFDLDGAMLHFTTDGKIPTLNSPVYHTPITIRKSAVFQVMAVHPDFRNSEVLTVRFNRIKPVHPDSFKLITPPSPQYPGKGSATLTDLRQGGSNLHDGAWLGFEGGEVECDLYFSKPARFSNLYLSALVNKGAWIFPPARVEVMGSIDGTTFHSLGQKTISEAIQPLPMDGQIFYTLPLSRKKVSQVKIFIRPFGRLPEGHPGAGKPAWLFLDEVIVE